ncbi:2-C-methyl-D-erythritol 4-phosphate cytidylyltransferase [Scrofimicrobium sp. R131]|uniref:2-C-methyl-D-erythritol 4-phosphate cytidylyltransferase n=1 Tax=Scrofimicrobium appendicitidis TaxID=3079930 RepID=A0AAU7V776_9ACTO
MASPSAVVVLTAAGTGTRLGADVPKALVQLGEHSLLAWSLRGLAQTEAVAAVAITAPADALDQFWQEIGRYTFPFPITVVPGGNARQESVACGLDALSQLTAQEGLTPSWTTPTLVHDAARALTPPEMIGRLIRLVGDGTPAVIPGLPVTDTIKEVSGEDQELSPVRATPPRARLRSIQTPQAFFWGVLLAAHERARALADDEATAATDDAALVEAEGGQVWVTPGHPHALKITTKKDLETAERMILGLDF